jgi:hypothetical protein
MIAQNQVKPKTPTHSSTSIAVLFLVSALCSGCLVVDERDGYDDGYDSRQSTEVYEDDTIIEDDTLIDEREEEMEEEIEESSMEEITEEEEEETTTTTTTVVETPSMPATEDLTCSVEDQGFGDATPVEAFVVVPPDGCEWNETSDDLPRDMGLGFVDVIDDEGYTGLFECGSQSAGSDIDWDNEVVVYLSGWIPAGSNPEFEWAVSGTEDEVILGLVSEAVCTDEVEFYQNAFIAPRRTQQPRVISCTTPTEC